MIGCKDLKVRSAFEVFQEIQFYIEDRNYKDSFQAFDEKIGNELF